MQIQKINSNTVSNQNFGARFMRSDDLNEVTAYEVRNNRSEAWQKGLKELDAIKKDVKLSLQFNDEGNPVITNLKNNSSVIWPNYKNDSRNLMELSNPFSEQYYKLFLAGQKANLNNELDKINNRFYNKY